MLTIKKIFYLFKILIAISFNFSVFSSFTALASENTLAMQEQLIKQVERLFQQNSESLRAEEVISLSNKIIPHQNKYPSEIIAKTYILLVDIAMNKGELETALQFSQDGLKLTNPNQKAYLCLQVGLAKIFTAKKHYKKLLTVTEQTIKSPITKGNAKYLLFALSYRSAAYAMLSQHGKALEDMQQVQNIIKQNPSFNEHISLLSILANAYYHLGEFETALAVQLKILKLRFNLNRLDNVNQTYYHLGNAYFNLQRYNDAYNAYWEAKRYAEKKSVPIYAAYAGQGLALTLQYQQQYSQATTELLQAKKIFHQHNLTTPYLETLISLAQISRETKQLPASLHYLTEAEKIAENVTLNSHYIIFYQLLAQMYLDKGLYDSAYFWQKKYSQALLRNKPANINDRASKVQEQNLIDSSATKELALKLAEQGELTSTFSTKYQQQQSIIFLLAFIVVALLFSQGIIWLRRRTKRSKYQYDAQEKPSYVLANPAQTKQLYQTNFNMAKKYSYVLTLGYISISNWQELTFKFNQKVVNEVSVGIASLINEYTNEFEQVGLINNGEYLLFFPHQSKEEANLTMKKIIQALRLRFFANLGEFSVTLSYSVESPDFQDIDPYIFLSQLSAAVKSI